MALDGRGLLVVIFYRKTRGRRVYDTYVSLVSSVDGTLHCNPPSQQLVYTLPAASKGRQYLPPAKPGHAQFVPNLYFSLLLSGHTLSRTSFLMSFYKNDMSPFLLRSSNILRFMLRREFCGWLTDGSPWCTLQTLCLHSQGQNNFCIYDTVHYVRVILT